MTPQSNPDVVAGWKALAERAAAARRDNIEMMDIYDVQSSKSECSDA